MTMIRERIEINQDYGRYIKTVVDREFHEGYDLVITSLYEMFSDGDELLLERHEEIENRIIETTRFFGPYREYSPAGRGRIPAKRVPYLHKNQIMSTEFIKKDEMEL